MRYFITGGAGFIGSNLVDRLLADRHAVIDVGTLVNSNAWKPAIVSYRGRHDITYLSTIGCRSPSRGRSAAERKVEMTSMEGWATSNPNPFPAIISS